MNLCDSLSHSTASDQLLTGPDNIRYGLGNIVQAIKQAQFFIEVIFAPEA